MKPLRAICGTAPPQRRKQAPAIVRLRVLEGSLTR